MLDMIIALHQETALLTALVILQVNANNCTNGWFGEDCKYLCHCAESVDCLTNGDCPNNGACTATYFGPGCQYIDLASTESSFTTRDYIIDFDETTCNPNQLATRLAIPLEGAFHIYWIRIHFTNITGSPNFTLTFNDRFPCINQRAFKFTDTAVDVRCDNVNLLTRVDLWGDIVPHVCSVYISGGRNVALKQPTRQSSIIPDDISRSESKNAVDGNYNKDYFAGSCAHTNWVSGTPWWEIRFNRPQILFRVHIFNRNENLHRIHGFMLETFTDTGNRTNYFKETTGENCSIYKITLESTKPVTVLRITGQSKYILRENVLTLCEVETYGDTDCPESSYGIYCGEQCRCKPSETCLQISGACGPPCLPGHFGRDCRAPCSSSNCKLGECRDNTEMCLHCNPGFIGDFCDQKCQRGTFGDNCSKNCSKHCATNCSFDTGYCDCTPPFTGSTCTDCPGGKYGEICTLDCPELCKARICYADTGECKACEGARIGPKCQECPARYYGLQCYAKCSEHCDNQTCDAMSGNCSICTDGFSGPQCNDAPPEDYSFLDFVLMACILAIVVILCCALYCCCCKKKALLNLAQDIHIPGEDGKTVTEFSPPK